MGARTLGMLVAAAVLWAGGARAQAPGTPGAGNTGSSATSGTGTGTSTAGTTGSGGDVTFDPLAAAAARLFGSYRVPGAAPVDASGVYRVDTGSSPPPAGSGSASSGTATTNTSASGSTTTGGAPTNTP
jgi:hypothetical protein